jgi:hypothetical protein
VVMSLYVSDPVMVDIVISGPCSERCFLILEINRVNGRLMQGGREVSSSEFCSTDVDTRDA